MKGRNFKTMIKKMSTLVAVNLIGIGVPFSSFR